MTCEKCWADAYRMHGDQVENYRVLIEKRKDNPCSPKEQAGQWWDEDRQVDTRRIGRD